MKKLALDVDDLRVVSFGAGSGTEAVRGTIRGHHTFWDACPTGSPTDCSDPTCGDCDTQPPNC
jgi:hypothetical protein